MKALFEFTGFLGLSVAAHLALWQGAPDGASPAAGAGGEATITLSGGTGTLNALVAEWKRPPEFLDAPPVPVMMVSPEETPPALGESAPQARPAPAIAPLAPVLPDLLLALPEVDPAPPPAPRSAFAPDVSPRPKPRPDQAETSAKPEPRPKPQSTAPPKQTAAGSGGKAAAGKTRESGAGAKNTVRPSASQMAGWGGAIRARVERRKRFPSAAAGQGKVGLWLKVTTAGQLAGAGLTRSSGNPAFDRAALSAVRRATLPRAPGGIAPGVYRFTLSMSFNR